MADDSRGIEFALQGEYAFGILQGYFIKIILQLRFFINQYALKRIAYSTQEETKREIGFSTDTFLRLLMFSLVRAIADKTRF